MTRRFVIALSLGLTACQPLPQKPNETRPVSTVGDRALTVLVWTDSETGCQYLQTRVHNGNVLTPRLGSDGRPICAPRESGR